MAYRLTYSDYAGNAVEPASPQPTPSPAGQGYHLHYSDFANNVTAPPGPAGDGGTVTQIDTSGSGISGGPITTAGTLTVQWNAGAATSIGDGLQLSGGVLSSTGTTYTLPTASTSVLGGVKIDGTSITITGGVISAITGGSGTVTKIDTTGAGISGGPITGTGTLSVQWNAGATTSLGAGLSLSAGVLANTVTAYTLPAATTTTLGGAMIASTNPAMNGTVNQGSLTTFARADHVHASDTTRQTSAQVVSAIAAGNPGAFSTLSASGAVTGAGFTALLSPYAPLASPTFSGMVTAPNITLSTDASQSAMSGAWTQTNPTPTASAGSLTAATAVVRYKKIGRVVQISVTVNITTAGSATGAILVPMPFTAGSPGAVCGREINATNRGLIGIINTGAASLQINSWDAAAVIITSGYQLVVAGLYESST